MKNDINAKARLAFVAFLLIAIAAGTIWYLFSANQYTTYQIYTQAPVSGLIADAPIEFHGVGDRSRPWRRACIATAHHAVPRRPCSQA
jgi:hypothetical protein